MTNTLTIVARVIEGLILFVFGVNGISRFYFFQPPPPTPELGSVMGALGSSVYFFPLLAITYIVTGLFLLSGRFVPLALVVVAPIIINIIFLHLFLAPAGIIPGLVLLTCNVFLAWRYRSSFRGVLDSRATPD